MILLAINWAVVGIKVAQLLLSLSILVVLHEFGHYITARWFGCRVEKFFLFFDPWFAIWKKKIGDTVYGIGWLPLGGYVKISGMIDESMDKEQMKQPPKEWEFRSKPAWQRLIVMLGGIIMNVLVAFVIYAFVLMIWGEKKVPASSMKYGVHIGDSTLMKIGFKDGDKILGVDGKPVYDLTKFRKKLLTAEQVQVERDGKQLDIKLPINFIGQLIENKNQRRTGFVDVRIPAMVLQAPDTSHAFRAGIRKNDLIVGIDSTRVQFYDEMYSQLQQHKGKDVLLTVNRDGRDTSFPTKILINEEDEGILGVRLYGTAQQMDSLGWLKLEVTRYNFASAFPAGVKKTFAELNDYLQQFKLILNPKTGGYKGVGGFKSIGSIFSPTWDWEWFWRMTAMLSVILAFMNLLPIPALDGGHVMFTLYEMITRRKPNEKFLEYAQMAGMILLLLLMLYANGNDWFGWGK
ncbi:MAG: RIP metalloprotease RseP [Chitinophagaceae bacterium]|nr:RIP metalloprotease RseP [Chitinophagaceae bacterium]